MKQEELRQLSRKIINGEEKEETLSTLTEEEQAMLLDILNKREAELQNKMQEADRVIEVLRKRIAYAEKLLSTLKGYTYVDNERMLN